MMNFVQCCLKSKLELTNELGDREVITGLDKNIFIGILNHRMEEVEIQIVNVDNYFKKFSTRSKRSKGKRKKGTWIMTKERYMVGVGRM